MKVYLISILIFLTLLSGCGKIEYVSVPAPIYPPIVYLEPVQEPQLKGKTNNDLAKYIFALRTAIAEGNHHKLKITEWIQEQEKLYQSQDLNKK
jgi:hypothetical protein